MSLLQCAFATASAAILTLLISSWGHVQDSDRFLVPGRNALAAALGVLGASLLLNRFYLKTTMLEELLTARDDLSKSRQASAGDLSAAVVRAERAETALQDVSRAIRGFIDSLNVDHSYEEFTVEYIIDAAGEDRWFRRYSIQAGDEPIRVVKGISVGAQGLLAVHARSVADLGVTTKTDHGTAVFLPFFDTGAGAGQEGAVLLNPRIEPHRVKSLEIGGLWAGMWNDLRSAGRDRGSLAISKPTKWLHISLIYPADWELDIVPISYPKCKYTTIIHGSEATGGVRRQQTWAIEDASTGTYVYDVIRKEGTSR